jgi:thymidine kinase
MSGGRGGEIQLILGPMFSGKTTELLRRMRRYAVAGKRYVVLKHALDNRYTEVDSDGVAITHDRQTCSAVPVADMIGDAYDRCRDADVVGIDEGQFFPDIVEFCERLANDCGKIVVVASLDGTYRREPFGRVLELVPRAESVVKLCAVCAQCHRDAAFTRRRGAETEVAVIGGADKYAAACRRCWMSGDS